MRLLAVTAFLILSATAFAQDSSALINKALDEQFNHTWEDKTPLPKVMSDISTQTGVRIKEDPLVWDLLPWGRDTTVMAKIENRTLREALDIITRKLGLKMVLREEFVEILPMPGLKRLAQRAGRDELIALDLLASKPLNLETDHPTVKRLLEAIDLKLADEKNSQFAIENRIQNSVPQEKTIFVPRNATLMDALESLTKETAATWYPWGKNIIVVTKDESTRRLLSKPLTIFPDPTTQIIDLTQLYTDIAKQTGVTVEFQAGAIQSLPPESRALRGKIAGAPLFENVPARQILEIVSAATGLQYAVQDDKVYVASPNAAAQRDVPIGFIQLDIGLQVLVPTSQVPPDLREYIRVKTERELNKMRKMMEEENFKPSTQPKPPAKENGDL
jgi:hypothetical protein